MRRLFICFYNVIGVMEKCEGYAAGFTAQNLLQAVCRQKNKCITWHYWGISLTVLFFVMHLYRRKWENTSILPLQG